MSDQKSPLPGGTEWAEQQLAGLTDVRASQIMDAMTRRRLMMYWDGELTKAYWDGEIAKALAVLESWEQAAGERDDKTRNELIAEHARLTGSPADDPIEPIIVEAHE